MADRKESPSLMEPMRLPSGLANRSELLDLVLELTYQSGRFRSSLPQALQGSLAGIVRSMNCYYSNLIEGHNTHPIAIERALQGNYDADPKKRDLQLEAKAHIEVQAWIDHGGIKDNIFSPKAMVEIHKAFYEKLPDELCLVENPETNKKIKVIPGEFRKEDVKVGNHVAISPGAIPRFLRRYEEAYREQGKSETILALAAAHHRFLWIHPFLDSNGRVARFISYATLLHQLDTGGLWSVSRGLARKSEEYKQYLANCDLTRRNDLDGRGHLSQEALVVFTKFFLNVCIDQVTFMEKLMDPQSLRTRILLWAKEEVALKHLPPQSLPILERILYRGELARGDIPGMLGLTDRQSRRITASLMAEGILAADSPKGVITLAFPATLASRFLPGLFPEG